MSSRGTPNKLGKTGIERNPDGTVKAGSVLNPNGRPKRKTLTEMIHAKLDDTEGGWETLVNIVLAKVREGDKDLIKALWEYTDGKPTQRQELTGKDGAELTGLVIVKNGSKPLAVADGSVGEPT